MMCSVQKSKKTSVHNLRSLKMHDDKIRRYFLSKSIMMTHERFVRIESRLEQKYYMVTTSPAKVYSIYNYLSMKDIESLRFGYYIQNTISDIEWHNNRNGKVCTQENCVNTIFSKNSNNAFNSQNFDCSACTKGISGHTGKIKTLYLKKSGNSIMQLKQKRCGKISTINVDHPHGGGEDKRKHVKNNYTTSIQPKGVYTNQKDRQFNIQRAII